VRVRKPGHGGALGRGAARFPVFRGGTRGGGSGAKAEFLSQQQVCRRNAYPHDRTPAPGNSTVSRCGGCRHGGSRYCHPQYSRAVAFHLSRMMVMPAEHLLVLPIVGLQRLATAVKSRFGAGPRARGWNALGPRAPSLRCARLFGRTGNHTGRGLPVVVYPLFPHRPANRNVPPRGAREPLRSSTRQINRDKTRCSPVTVHGWKNSFPVHQF